MSTTLRLRIGAASILSLLVTAGCSGLGLGDDNQSSNGVGGATSATENGGRTSSNSVTSAGGRTGSSARTGGTSQVSAAAQLGGEESSGGDASEGGSSVRTTRTSAAPTKGGASAISSTEGTQTKAGGAGGRDSTDTAKATGGRNPSSATTSSPKGGSSTGGRGSVSSTAAGGKSSAGGTNASGGKAVGGSATGGKATGGSTTGTAPDITGEDGCTDTLASGITISEVAIFQSGKLSIMKAGAEVKTVNDSGAEVIEGRDAMFRVYVTTDSGFQARPISARLKLSDGSNSYSIKQTISASSSELTPANSFIIPVPGKVMNAGLNYSVELVECGTGSGTDHSPRFPATGTASIATRATGIIRLTVIPVTANNITPDLTALAPKLKDYLESLYPVTSVEITTSSTPITGCGITPAKAGDGTAWSNCLTLVRNRRVADKPANDVYYMGVVTPATSYAGYCGSACIAGVGYQSTSATGSTMASARAAISIGFDAAGLSSIAHELGHNHGLLHSPGCGADSADTAFPHQTSGKAYIGWVGWDHRSPNAFIDPAKTKDLMSYCEPLWVSDYVYDKFADRIAALNGAAMLMGAQATESWRVLDVIGDQPTWGPALNDPVPPAGEAESATIYDRDGNIVIETTVYRTAIQDARGAMYLVPEPEPNWAAISIGSMYVEF